MNALVWKWILWRTNGVDWQATPRNTTLSLMQCGGSHFARDSWCKSRENVLTRSQWEVRVCERKREGEMEMNKMIFYRLSDHVSGGEVVWFLQAQWLTLAFCSLALLLCSFVPVFLTVGCLLLSLLFFNLLISPSLFFLFNLFLFLYFLFHLFRTNCRGMYTLDDIYSEVDIWLPAVVVMQGQAVVKIKFALTCRILNIRNSFLSHKHLIGHPVAVWNNDVICLIILAMRTAWSETPFWHFWWLFKAKLRRPELHYETKPFTPNQTMLTSITLEYGVKVARLSEHMRACACCFFNLVYAVMSKHAHK